jgi:AcrR family transcriptional regulator
VESFKDEHTSHRQRTKAAFYRHFASKDDVVLTFPETRDQVCTVDLATAEARRRADNPRQQLLADSTF